MRGGGGGLVCITPDAINTKKMNVRNGVDIFMLDE